MTDKDTALLEQLISNISDYNKGVTENNARIDERVKILIEQQIDNNKKFGELIAEQRRIMDRIVILESKNVEKIASQIQVAMDNYNITNSRINDLEKRIISIEDTNKSISNKLTEFATVVVKILVSVLVLYLLWKLGINPALLQLH